VIEDFFYLSFHRLKSAKQTYYYLQMSTKKSIGQQLYDAASAGNVTELRRLIEGGGADVNATYGVSVYVCWHVHSN
jgi:hypothetical protein